MYVTAHNVTLTLWQMALTFKQRLLLYVLELTTNAQPNAKQYGK
jgi:hypothetical protein